MNDNRGDGRLWDLKYINICLKGVFGIAVLSDMGSIDFNDARMKFIQGKFEISLVLPIISVNFAILSFTELFAIRVNNDRNRLVYFESYVQRCMDELTSTLFRSQFKR